MFLGGDARPADRRASRLHQSERSHSVPPAPAGVWRCQPARDLVTPDDFGGRGKGGSMRSPSARTAAEGGCSPDPPGFYADGRSAARLRRVCRRRRTQAGDRSRNSNCSRVVRRPQHRTGISRVRDAASGVRGLQLLGREVPDLCHGGTVFPARASGCSAGRRRACSTRGAHGCVLRHRAEELACRLTRACQAVRLSSAAPDEARRARPSSSASAVLPQEGWPRAEPRAAPKIS